MDIGEKPFRIIVKPNSPKNEIAGFDNEKKAYRVNIKAKAEDNKANVEVIKFFSKLLKKRVRIVAGRRSREKILRIE
jgi:uncharacterized protein (TIGR00251 family)